MSTLKPCPFCGGEAHFTRKGTPRYSTVVQCSDCGCALESNENHDPGRAWNSRALPHMQDDEPLTEEWLASVGFKYRDPHGRQPFKHWAIKFNEKNDYGLEIETTKPGWINQHGEHIGADGGWFLWIKREHKHIHLRHILTRAEMIQIIEAISGLPWNPNNHVWGQVWEKSPISELEGGE